MYNTRKPANLSRQRAMINRREEQRAMERILEHWKTEVATYADSKNWTVHNLDGSEPVTFMPKELIGSEVYAQTKSLLDVHKRPWWKRWKDE